MPRTTGTKRGKSTPRSTTDLKISLTDREARITSAGILQSVIASGAPIEQWRNRAMYGLRLHMAITKRLMGTKVPLPKPKQRSS